MSSCRLLYRRKHNNDFLSTKDFRQVTQVLQAENWCNANDMFVLAGQWSVLARIYSDSGGEQYRPIAATLSNRLDMQAENIEQVEERPKSAWDEEEGGGSPTLSDSSTRSVLLSFPS